MTIFKRASTGFSSILLELACMSPAFAADAAMPQADSWRWWSEMPWPAFGWILPLICILMMVVMLGRGGMGCMWRGPSADRSDTRSSMKRYRDEPAVSALEILNARYASGRIDKQEHEDKKSAIAASR